jgi:hypothetical protein
MEAGISTHVWTIEGMCGMLPEAASAAKRIDKGLILNTRRAGELNENSGQVATFNLGNRISGKFSGADLCVSRLFPRQCIFRGIAEAPKSARIVLVSLVYDFLFGRRLHDGVVVSYISQTVRQAVEIKLTH